MWRPATVKNSNSLATMRRIRTPSDGEHVILEPTPRRPAAGGFVAVRLEVLRQFAVDADVRKLLGRIRRKLGSALVAGAGPNLSKHWSMTPISGSSQGATTELVDTARSAAAYLGNVADDTRDRVVPEVVREWLRDAVPVTGDGVGTEARVDTSGGPLPR